MYKIQPIRVAYIKSINLKFCAPFKIIYRNGRNSLIKKTRFLIFLYFIQERTVYEENQKFAHWILRLSNRDYGYLILKFSEVWTFKFEDKCKISSTISTGYDNRRVSIRNKLNPLVCIRWRSVLSMWSLLDTDIFAQIHQLNS